MKTHCMIRGLLLIALATLAGLWLVTALRSCARETLGEVEARTDELTRLVDSAERAIQSVLGGGVSISNHGVIQVPREIAELAVLEHEVSVTTSMTRSRWFGWFPSTLCLTGNYSGKLGIDVEQVQGGFDPETGILELDLPPAKILSVEMTGMWRSFEAQSWFTPVAPYEVMELVSRNASEARQRLNGGAVLEGADRDVEGRLRQALRSVGLELRTEEPAG